MGGMPHKLTSKPNKTMNANHNCHIYPFASAPLQHLAQSLAPLDGDEIELAWNTAYPDRHDTHALFSENRTVLCMETPLIGRPNFQFDGSADPERCFYRIAVNDPTAMGTGYVYDGTYQRFDRLLKLSGRTMRPWRQPAPEAPILYALQVPGDNSLRGLDPYLAAFHDLLDIHRATRRRVILGVHPDCHRDGWAIQRHRDYLPSFQKLANLAGHLGCHVLDPTSRLSDYFDSASMLVSHTSGTSFDALVDGLPCIALNDNNFASLATPRTVDFDATSMVDRRERLSWLSRIEWSWAEIGRGEHLGYVRDILRNVK